MATLLPRRHQAAWFLLQDDWKVSRRLTLSLGLRWDKDFNMIGGSDIQDSRSYLDLRSSTIPNLNPYVSSIAKDDNLDFSPRVGFAYDLTGKGNSRAARRLRAVLRQRLPEHSSVHGADGESHCVSDRVSASPDGTDVVPGTGILLDRMAVRNRSRCRPFLRLRHSWPMAVSDV